MSPILFPPRATGPAREVPLTPPLARATIVPPGERYLRRRPR